MRNKLEAENRQIIAEIEDMKRTLKDGCELLESYRKINESEEKGGDAVKKEQTEKENS